MRRIYQWCGGRKVFQAYLFVGMVLGLTVAYWMWADVPDFRWVVAPLSAAMLGTQFSVAWEDRAQSVLGKVARELGGEAKGSEQPEPGEQ